MQAAPPVLDAPPPASHVTVTAASVVPLALAAAPTATHVAVTAVSAVPRVTVASLAAPAVAVTAANEGKQTSTTGDYSGLARMDITNTVHSNTYWHVMLEA
ncbi:Hypp1892 [Branchiostoma lanceolatum]|uniref:Hypp1892 protein n=1 Tax=Branchiostoma lanceolatum TaxID=7740 RepID=A0A8J9ZN33_BRALA|nr:Hypp1892 [Branchiostoma lanceolatum]